MNARIRNFCIFALSCLTMPTVAQNVASPPATLQLSGYKTQAASVPAGSSSTTLTFTVEGDATGDNIFEIATSDPGVVVSLVLPSNLEVTGANAGSLGFTFTTIPEGTIVRDDVESPLSLPGTHTFIQIPGGQPSGIYTIKANASTVSADSGMIATYYASSTVRAAATTNAANYKVGDTVVLSGLVFDGQTPISGATVTAVMNAPVSLSGQTSLGNYQLVSQQTVNANLSDYSYTVTLTNTGGAIQQVRAELASSLPARVANLNDTLVFGDVAANSTATSINTITIERDPNQSFAPSNVIRDSRLHRGRDA